MNWSFLLFAFSVAVITGAIGVTTLARLYPKWSRRKHGLVAAAILPGMACVAMIGGLLNLALSDVSDGMESLAFVAIIRAGVISAVIGFVGGLLGAALRQRGLRR